MNTGPGSHCPSSKRARRQRPLLVLTNSLFIKCCDASTHTQSVRNERSLPPEERTAVFLKEPVFGEKRFVGLSFDFSCLVRYFWSKLTDHFMPV